MAKAPHIDPRSLIQALMVQIKRGIEAVEQMTPPQVLANSQHLVALTKVMLELDKLTFLKEDYSKMTKDQLQERVKQAQKMVKQLPDGFGAEEKE